MVKKTKAKKTRASPRRALGLRIQGRKKLDRTRARELSDRIRLWSRHVRCDKTLKQFAERIDVSRQTVEGWLHAKNPVTPDLPALLRFAALEKVNLNWLLLGVEEPEMRGVSHAVSEISVALRNHLVERLTLNVANRRRGHVEEFLRAEDAMDQLAELVSDCERRYQEHRRQVTMAYMITTRNYANRGDLSFYTSGDEPCTGDEMEAVLEALPKLKQDIYAKLEMLGPPKGKG